MSQSQLALIVFHLLLALSSASTCYYFNACNHNLISAMAHGTSDEAASCSPIHPFTLDFSKLSAALLTLAMTFSANANGKPIRAARGGVLTDSCLRSYSVGKDCKLTLIGPRAVAAPATASRGNCTVRDECSGQNITAAKGGLIEDSCPNWYNVGDDCKLYAAAPPAVPPEKTVAKATCHLRRRRTSATGWVNSTGRSEGLLESKSQSLQVSRRLNLLKRLPSNEVHGVRDC